MLEFQKNALKNEQDAVDYFSIRGSVWNGHKVPCWQGYNKDVGEITANLLHSLFTMLL